jgi:hypothetical protein
LAGFAEHERRIEEIEGISHSGTEAWSSESGKERIGEHSKCGHVTCQSGQGFVGCLHD